MAQHVRKGFIFSEKVYSMLNEIKERKGFTSEVDAITYAIMETYEMVVKKYATETAND